jgi:Divergent InlB B-repeat domain
MNQYLPFRSLLCVFFTCSRIASAELVNLYYDAATPQIAFAAGDIKLALEKQKHQVKTHSLAELKDATPSKKVVLALSSDERTSAVLKTQGTKPLPEMGPQAYALRTGKNPDVSYWVIGGDATGTMYGGIQFAENITSNGLKGSYEEEESPYLENRGMKLNIPLDKRIPTYVGGWSSNSAKKAIPHVWDMEFWKKLIDQQARNRYNVLSIWVHHPFPALVKLPDYPKVSLPRIEGFDGFVKELNHDQRVKFWRDVMRYAKDRGMKFYFFNWNIHLEHASDQYPTLTEEPDDKETVDYMYKSMRALLETYPELDGFGITSGDGMDGSKEENTQWTWNAMGKAVMDYLRENPKRQFNLIHRGVKSDPETVNEIYAPIKEVSNANLQMSAKYAMAHMYSTPTPRWTGHIQSSNELGLKTWLTFRNDDYFYLNWGDSQFVRDFINGIPLKDTVVGMYIGIDGYNPSRVYCYKNEALNGQLEVERRWFMEMLWGRISYNPKASDEVFRNLLGNRFPKAPSAALYDSWTLASRSLPKVTELIMKDWSLDFHWYPEGCWSDPNRCSGFRTIDDTPGPKGGFAGQDVAKGSSLCNIADSAAGKCDGKKSSYTLADEMQADAKKALALIAPMTSGGDPELEFAINNIKQLGLLSTYYAHKIRGATYKKAGKIDEAKFEMGKAYCAWMGYSRSMDQTYHPDSFRNLAISPDWKYADAAVLKEYADLGGEGVPECENMFTLSTKAANGSIALEPSGAVYAKGTQVKATATPDFGYEFRSWGGDLTGFQSPATVNMNAKKSVAANFVANSKPDSVPWQESFAMADGTQQHGCPTSWMAKRSKGMFQVSGNRMMINEGKGEAVLETAEIEIPKDGVTVSLEVQSVGALDSGDFVRLYSIVDGNEPELIDEEVKGQVEGTKTLKKKEIVGKMLKLRIETEVSASDEFYFLDNLMILPSRTSN